ncbi:hypothetical protein NVP1262O_49 [Vibrio phage 1.262.O._10N.286.51.A9]|nr:hypothetical protein NVP1262O_49 [Vibrio phage 1.262.O._10N.286.51.A9]
MACYSYKDVCVPVGFQDEWCRNNGVDEDDLQDGDAIAWEYWDMVSDYINYLEDKIHDLNAEIGRLSIVEGK